MLPDPCAHPEDQVEIRRFRRAFGGESFRRFCLVCGSKLDARPLDPMNLPGGIHPSTVALHPTPCIPRFNGKGNSKRRNFEKFLRSSKWRKQRDRVLARDRYLCQDCGAPAECAAHIRYASPIEATPDRDIKASCNACNMAERERRITRGVLGPDRESAVRTVSGQSASARSTKAKGFSYVGSGEAGADQG